MWLVSRWQDKLTKIGEDVLVHENQEISRDPKIRSGEMPCSSRIDFGESAVALLGFVWSNISKSYIYCDGRSV